MLIAKSNSTRNSNPTSSADSRGRTLTESLVRLGLVVVLLAGMILVLPAAPAAAGSRVPAPAENELSISDAKMEEGDSGETYFKFTVTRANPSSSSSVGWYTKDGTASSKEPDYVSASGAVKFADGETTRTVEIKVYGDTKVEEDETFAIYLEKPSNATLVDSKGLGTILNDDGSSGDTWDLTGSLNTARYRHTATRLNDSRILVAGGLGGNAFLNSAEIYDLTSGKWATINSMGTARQDHTATRLNDGRVLVVGGYSNTGPLNNVEIYDPTSGKWATANPMATARYNHTAARLGDGRVLVVGGYGSNGGTSSAEIYDPTSDKWTTTNPLADTRWNHTATLLNDGRILVAGGYNGTFLSSAEIYDPKSGKWATANPMVLARTYHTATRLKDGRVLVVGGVGSKKVPIGSPEIYDPASGKWATASPMTTARAYHTATLLNDGRVLVAGGDNMKKARAALLGSELYDPDAGTWSASLGLNVARTNHTATLLGDGSVLAMGGWSTSGIVGSSELHDGPAPTAVDLVSFGAEAANGAIRLRWETATEVDNLGFNLYRSDSPDGERVQLNNALIPSQSFGSPVGTAYEFIDEDVEAGITYYYWLEDVDLDGTTTMHGPASASVKLYLQKPLPVRRRLPPALPIEPGPLPPIDPSSKS